MPVDTPAFASTQLVPAGAFCAGLVVGMAAARVLLVTGPLAAALALLALAAVAGLLAHEAAAAWQQPAIAD
jgi:hypothetical protein